MSPHNAAGSYEFGKNWTSGSHILLRESKRISRHTFHIYYPIWVKFGVSGWTVMLSKFCELCENMRKEAILSLQA
jgi:hypothetical protein